MIGPEKKIVEYKDYFSVDFKAVDHSDFYKLEEKMFSKLKDCMENNHFEEALEIAEQIEYECVQNNNLLYTINMLEIYKERVNMFKYHITWADWCILSFRKCRTNIKYYIQKTFPRFISFYRIKRRNYLKTFYDA